jgi:phage-related protein
MYKIHFYEDARENCPIENLMAELNKKAETDKQARGLLKKIIFCLGILAEDGTRAGENFTKHIEGKLWELRPGDHRVFFFLWSGNNIVLLHSFRKETRKTPSEEIDKAKREMEDWISRHGH